MIIEINELFPYQCFGVRIEYEDEKKICWFKDNYDLQKYLNRYNLDKKNIKIDYRDEQPPESNTKHNRSVEQKPKSKSDGSKSPVRKRKSSVDPGRNIARNSKSKK